jgi:hypothetical protein
VNNLEAGYIPRMLGPVIDMALRQFPVVVLTGARQTGESTLVQKLPSSAPRRVITAIVLLKYFVLINSAGLAACLTTSAAALDLQTWEASVNPQTKERFIPVELWAGAEWDGKKELKMPPVNNSYRHRRSQYDIKGPVEWAHPVIGQTFVVYERINPGREGVKWQLFTINQEKNGLGRVYDARPGLGTRMFSGGLKFPLGTWKEGETRKFVYKHYDGARVADRAETITIKQIDFQFQQSAHCLEFYWTATDRDEKRFYDRQTYIYCPGQSMVNQIQH